MLTKLLVVVVIIKCTSMLETGSQLSIGSKCSVPDSDMPGECKLLKNCPNAIQGVGNISTQPSHCEYSGLEPTICCATKRLSDLKRVEKCAEYAKSVYVEGKTNTCLLNEVPVVVEESVARPGEFSHIALLGYNGTVTGSNQEIDWYGAGSLISTRFVLTSGHYLNPSHFGPIRKVRLGDLNGDRFVTDILVEQIIPHPDFNPPSMYHDIGLLKLAEKVPFSRFIRPICLPTADITPPNKLIALGWRPLQSYETTRNKLNRGEVNVVTNEECNLHYIYNISRIQGQGLIDGQMCATINSKQREICRGDVLQMKHPDTYCMYIQIGIVSYGRDCIPGVPNLFTKVSAYTDWIDDIISGSGQDD